jgi:hypothetical protein
MKRAIALAVLALLAGCSGTPTSPRGSDGQVLSPTHLPVTGLEVGDCVGPLVDGDIAKVEVIPCVSPHYWEAYNKKYMTGGDYPGDEVVATEAKDYCTAEYIPYVGAEYGHSNLVIKYFAPNEQTWKQGDREIVCLVGTETGGLTGTVKGSELESAPGTESPSDTPTP